MWNKDKSVKLTHFLVRAFYGVLTAVTVLCIVGCFHYDYFMPFDFFSIEVMLIPFFVSIPAGYYALVCLDKLLIHIKKGIVFEAKNVKLLRVFSWLCMFVAAVTGAFSVVLIATALHESYNAAVITGVPLAGYLYSALAFCAAVAELFVGLVARVVKNIFEAAIQIKEENDLTI